MNRDRSAPKVIARVSNPGMPFGSGDGEDSGVDSGDGEDVGAGVGSGEVEGEKRPCSEMGSLIRIV